MTDAELLTDPELDQVRWDLSDLIDGAGPGDPPAAVEARVLAVRAVQSDGGDRAVRTMSRGWRRPASWPALTPVTAGSSHLRRK